MLTPDGIYSAVALTRGGPHQCQNNNSPLIDYLFVLPYTDAQQSAGQWPRPHMESYSHKPNVDFQKVLRDSMFVVLF